MFLATHLALADGRRRWRACVPTLTTPAAYEDLFFALLTSTEMLTNH